MAPRAADANSAAGERASSATPAAQAQSAAAPPGPCAAPKAAPALRRAGAPPPRASRKAASIAAGSTAFGVPQTAFKPLNQPIHTSSRRAAWASVQGNGRIRPRARLFSIWRSLFAARASSCASV
ncbi:MAG: hypothetical protein MUC63_10485 [Planctomycetes bacterium]|nr:hypothetical protein [Planctomycetota bacterium]